MARPHIEFIQSQVIPFKKDLYIGIRDNIESRILSIDNEDGSSSCILKYPSGWLQNQPQALLVDEEFFVLEGSLEINGQIYAKHSYAHFPRGYAKRSHSSKNGAVVLTFFSGKLAIEETDINLSEYDDNRMIKFIDTQKMEGETGPRKHMNSGDWDPSGTIHKKLYQDPYSGELTWLVGLMPGWWSAKAEIHPVVEEEFAILGDICFPIGVMRDGGYFWRPPGIEHGPFATWGGTLHICRCKGGAYSTDWQESEGPNWNPKYDPILPSEYREYLNKSGDNYDKEPGY
ncbi:MAG: hypothetical protein CBC47_06130 [Alphaproteobacteria bacterium TMED87]|nr:hypothetical protein [Rhodospirillaceae bacterium]OUV09096.1 MAG: hypothetical protein CBC47_06130 [Alphaproteobacteria bacterium TMED87]